MFVEVRYMLDVVYSAALSCQSGLLWWRALGQNAFKRNSQRGGMLNVGISPWPRHPDCPNCWGLKNRKLLVDWNFKPTRHRHGKRCPMLGLIFMSLVANSCFLCCHFQRLFKYHVRVCVPTLGISLWRPCAKSRAFCRYLSTMFCKIVKRKGHRFFCSSCKCRKATCTQIKNAYRVWIPSYGYIYIYKYIPKTHNR